MGKSDSVHNLRGHHGHHHAHPHPVFAAPPAPATSCSCLASSTAFQQPPQPPSVMELKSGRQALQPTNSHHHHQPRPPHRNRRHQRCDFEFIVAFISPLLTWWCAFRHHTLTDETSHELKRLCAMRSMSVNARTFGAQQQQLKKQQQQQQHEQQQPRPHHRSRREQQQQQQQQQQKVQKENVNGCGGEDVSDNNG